MTSILKFAGSTAALMLTAATISMTTMSTHAADLPMRVETPPAPVVTAVYNWTGIYVGVNGGYGWGSQDPLDVLSTRFDRSSTSISGGMVGGTAGAQIQQSYVVLGLEADIDWANIKGTSTVTPLIAGIVQGGPVNVALNTSALSTARLRFGAAMDNWLLYGTAGVGFSKSGSGATSVSGVPSCAPGIIPNCVASAWRPGIAAGLGTEWGFARNWSAKVEYIYLGVLGTSVSTDHINTVRGGINYRF